MSFRSIVAQVVDVEVKDGKARARRVVCAVDPGFAFHPDGMRAQMESGIIYGLTAALYGEISIHRGSVAQSNFPRLSNAKDERVAGDRDIHYQ